MKVCYYGTYDQKYTRSVINIAGLRNNNVTVIECHFSKPEFVTNNTKSRIKFYIEFPFSLIYRNIFLFFKGLYYYQRYKYDIIFVGDSCHFEVLSAYLIGKITRKKVIFDPLLSLYDIYVNNYKTFSNKILISGLKNVEKMIYKLPDLIFVHTHQDVEFFHKTYGIPTDKLAILYVGANVPKIIRRSKKENKTFNVVYSGAFIPLHGIEYILGAAKSMMNNRDIKFIFTGKGIKFSESESYVKQHKLSNVELLGWVSDEKLASVVNNADILLGIFQNDTYLPRCIPNKVFQSISYEKPTITADSPAIKELFTHKKNIYLCKAGSVTSLTESILLLKRNPLLAKKIAVGGRKLYDQSLNPTSLGKVIINHCATLN